MVAGVQQPTMYLLDTNILVAYIRAGNIGEHVENTYHLRKSPYRPMISIVSAGEILSLAKLWGWGEEKQLLMKELLEEFVIIDLNSREIWDAYAELDFFSQKQYNPAEKMSKNDLWIAATAKVLGIILLTTDKDFNKFHPEMLTRIFINPEDFRK